LLIHSLDAKNSSDAISVTAGSYSVTCSGVGGRTAESASGRVQPVGVLLQPAMAQLGQDGHPLNDADGMFNVALHFGLAMIFHALDHIDNTAVAAQRSMKGACWRITAR